MEQSVSFGSWLRLKRKALDLTRENLADQVGCSAATIRKLEAEERRPSTQIVERLAAIFDVPQSEQVPFLRFARGELRSAPGESSLHEPWQAAGIPPRTNLPTPPTAIIGRDKEITAISGLILNPKIRLVTLLGPPGIGKTRLSLEAARALLPHFHDGVFFVSLAPLDRPDLIASTILQALGFLEMKNQIDLERIKEGIGERDILLVLDNLEHLIQSSATLVIELLLACPHIKILTTSREALRVPGEWLFPVPSLRFPLQSEAALNDFEAASRFSALTLFAERARAIRPDFMLTSENLEAVAEICMRLDGLPLAIELVVAQIRLMSPQALLSRMSGEFVLNMDSYRTVPDRLRTLYHAIDWSYDLLSPDERRLFAYLSVFTGGFSLETAEKAFQQTSFQQLVGVLSASLLDKSLLQRISDATGEPRFHMLVTIQQFAFERLQEAGEEIVARDMHLAYFLQLAEQANREVHGPEQVKWFHKLEMEHINFRSALEWCLSSSPQKTETALRLLVALGWSWGLHSHDGETRGWHEKLSSLPEVKEHQSLYAALLLQVATNSWTAGNFHQAGALLEECRSIFLAIGPDGECSLAQTWYLLGMVARWGEGDNRTAKSLYEKSFELYQKNNDPWGIAQTTFLLAIIEEDQGNDAQALAMFEHSLELFQQLGDLWAIGRLSQHIGEQYLKQGDEEKAFLFFNQHLNIDEELDFKEGIVVALRNLGNYYRYRGDYARADQYYDKSLAICREYDLKDDTSKTIFYLGLLALHRNDYELAAWYFTNNFGLAKLVNERKSACDLLIGMAAVAGGTHQPERAARLSGAAQAILDTIDLPYKPFDRAEFDRHIYMARDQLGKEQFEALSNEGRSIPPEQAISDALSSS